METRTRNFRIWNLETSTWNLKVWNVKFFIWKLELGIWEFEMWHLKFVNQNLKLWNLDIWFEVWKTRNFLLTSGSVQRYLDSRVLRLSPSESVEAKWSVETTRVLDIGIVEDICDCATKGPALIYAANRK